MKQQTIKAARWLHIYLSMVSFGVVLFFAATGLTVNHPDWFSGAVHTRQRRGVVEGALLREPEVTANKARLVESLRTREHLHGHVDDLHVDDAELTFSYRAPGYSADITIDRARQTYTVTEVRNGFVAVVNDLHKGRDAGKLWAGLIDVSAVLLTLVSLTGLLILCFLYKRRSSGLIAGGVGLAVCLLIYRFFVP